MIAFPTTQSPSGPHPSAAWAQARLEAARPTKRQRLSEVLLVLLLAALVGVVMLFAHEAGQAGFESYTQGARNVTLSALFTNPRAYEGQRVHVRGQAGTVYATDTQYQFVLAEPGAAAGSGSARQIMVVTGTAPDVAGGTTVNVWGVPTAATTAGTTSTVTSATNASSGSLPVLILDARYVRAAP